MTCPTTCSTKVGAQGCAGSEQYVKMTILMQAMLFDNAVQIKISFIQQFINHKEHVIINQNMRILIRKTNIDLITI